MDRYLGLNEQVGGKLPIRFTDEVAAAIIKPNGFTADSPNRVNVEKYSFAKVVAIDSVTLSHGMPYPDNVKSALEVESAIRTEGAIPATIAIINGVIHVGLTNEELDHFGKMGPSCAKVSRRDLPVVLSSNKTGATTVSGAMLIARMVGIEIMCTGGIGGVHVGAEKTFDISADLMELGKCPVLVVCGGVKSVLDTRKTLEVLETQGVTVLSYQHDKFPSFFTRDSGYEAPQTLHTPSQVANYLIHLKRLGYPGGGVLAVPIPEEDELEGVEEAIKTAIKEGEEMTKRKELFGRDITPYLMKRLNELTKGKSLKANMALVKNNAKVAAQAAVSFHKRLCELE